MIEVLEDQVFLFEMLEKAGGIQQSFQANFYTLCKIEADLSVVIFIKEGERKGLLALTLADYENNYFGFHELISEAIKRYEYILHEDMMHELVLDLIKEADKIKAKGWFLEGH